jgi:formylglycine-generating enzyme required for sulfatase activity
MKKTLFLLTFVGFSWILFAQNKPTIEFVTIPAGTFTMGSPENEPERTEDEVQHQVTISSFEMSTYEITFAQYDKFCDATGRNKPDDEGMGRGFRPVMNVSWFDAKAFAEWMGCRLPTEAEWEYACRAGTTTPFYTGTCLTPKQANINGKEVFLECGVGDSLGRPTPVGTYAPNAWGLYDMHGNVYEWCSDYYGKYNLKELSDPKGPKKGEDRIIRGGCWFYGAYYGRCAYRNYDDPAVVYNSLGFRIVRDITPKQ